MSKEKSKIINSSIEVNFQDFQPVSNTGFVRGVCKVAYAGKNRNYTDIPKEAFEEAESTIFGIPIVGNWLGENFGGHDVILETRGNDMIVKDNTVPYGFVPQDANPRWETVEDDNGNSKSYYTVDVILWKQRYPEEVQFIIDNGVNQSMEILAEDVDWGDDGEYLTINDFYYSALCLLGREIDLDGNKGSADIEPCFEDSEVSVGTFSMSDKFKKDLFAIKSAFEGGEELDKDKDKAGKKEEVTEPAKKKEPTADKARVEDEVKDVTKEEHTNVDKVVAEDVEEVEVELETETEADTHEVAEDLEDESDSIDSSKEEFDYELEFKALKDKFDNLESEYKDLETKFKALELENEELKSYKDEKELEILNAQKDELIDDYSLILSAEDIVDISDQKDNFKLDELKSELARVFAEREVEKAKSTKGKKNDDTIMFENKHKTIRKNKFAI